MSDIKIPSARLQLILDKAIDLAKKEFGEKFDTRYACSVVDEHGYRCSDTATKPTKGYNEFCSKHGNLIQEYQTTEYATQPWQDVLNDYFYESQKVRL